MTPEDMLAAITKIAEGLKTDMAAHCATLDAKYGEIADSVAKIKKADEAGSRSVKNNEMRGDDLDDTMATQTAADRARSDALKKTELAVIAADKQTFNNVLAEIRSDATEAAMSPVGMQPFQHREVTQTLPSGHRVTTFVGVGSMFAQMSRPCRQVGFIGPRADAPRHH